MGMGLLFQLVNYTENNIKQNITLSKEFAIFFLIAAIVFFICKYLNVSFKHYQKHHQYLEGQNVVRTPEDEKKVKFTLRGRAFDIPIVFSIILFCLSLVCLGIYSSQLVDFNRSPCEVTLTKLVNGGFISKTFQMSYLTATQLAQCNVTVNKQ